eukprot:680866-Amphidinium_carterae.1
MKWSATVKAPLRRCRPYKQAGANPKDATETWTPGSWSCESRMPCSRASASVGSRRTLLRLMWTSAG